MKLFNLSGKVALIQGGSRGIGAAIVRVISAVTEIVDDEVVAGAAIEAVIAVAARQ